MRLPEEILVDMIQTFLALDKKVNYFGDDGILRNIFAATSYGLADQEIELARIKRSKNITTADSNGLDDIAINEYYTQRKGPTKSTALVIIQGPVGQQVPAGTEFSNKVTGEKYLSKNDIVIGSTNPAVPGTPIPGQMYFPGIGNPSLSGADGSITFGHWAWVESVNSGSITKSSANTITVTANQAITVFNPAPTTGGSDAESDDELRIRLLAAKFSQSTYTNSFFNTIALEANTTIQKVIVEWNPITGLNFYLCNRSACQYTSAELTAIEDYIKNRIPAFFQSSQNTIAFAVHAHNVSFTGIDIEFQGKFKPNPTIMDSYITIIDRLGDQYINPIRLDFGQPILDDMVLKGILDTKLALDLQLSSIRVNGTTKVTPLFNSICRINSVKMIDDLTSTTINLSLLSSGIA